MTSAGDPEQTSDGLKTASLIGDDNTVTVYVVELGGDVQQVSLVAPTDSVEREEAKEDEANEAQEAEEEKDSSADSVAMATETAEINKTVMMTGKTSIAVQANDYEIERRSGILPARRRIIPFKFRDFHDPDEMDQDNLSDTDYIPGEVEVAPSRRGRRPGRPPGSRGRGRPRALPKDHCYDRSEEASGAGEASQTGSEEKAGVGDGEKAPEYCDESGGYTCDSSNCGQRFSRLAALKQHKLIQHTGGPARRGRPPKGSIRSTSHNFKCQECSKTFNQKGNMKVHLRVHTGEKPFKCSIPECGKSFCSNESLKRHKLAHMGVKLFPCDICEQKFSSNVALKEHIARHTDTRPYKCDVCDRWFRQVSCLRRHMITHSDETPFSCNVCGRRFSQMVYLKSHMRIHTGEKPFKCKTCNKQFAHHSDLIRHHTVHSGNKPYKCDVCGAAFSDPSSRRRHLREHNGLKPYTCQLCKENFKRSGQLKAHLNKKHMLNKSDIVITKSGQLSGLQFELDSATCGQVQTLVLQENPQYVDETATLEHLAARQEETMVVQRSTPGEAPLVDGADENHIIVAQTRLSELAEDGEEQQRQLVVETQRLVQQIQSQLDGASGDGQMLHVAYQIMRDEDNQPILEIQYQPTGGHQDGAGEDIGISQEERGEGELQMLEGEGKTMVVQSMWGEGEEQIEQPEMEQTQDDVGPSQQLMMVQSEEGPSELTNDNGLQSDQMVSVSPPLVKQQQMDIVPSVDTSPDCVTMTTSHDHLPNEPENQVSPLLHIDGAVDYVHQPDFASQDYYNWLSNFTEACQATPLPLDAEHFHKISQVHKSLADVLAMPTGILADKGNFRILMSISRELNEIINEHLTFVLQGLKDNDK